MQKGKSFFSVALCAFIILFFMVSMSSFAADKPAAPIKQAPKKAAPPKPVPVKPVSLRGVIEAVETNESGQAIRIRILAGEARYPITLNEKGKELLPLIGKTVEINGGLKPNKKGKNVLAVKTFKVVE